VICAYEDDKREKKKRNERCCSCLIQIFDSIFKKTNPKNHFIEPLECLKKRDLARGNLLRVAHYNSFLKIKERKQKSDKSVVVEPKIQWRGTLMQCY
jgi:hypothetical protein